MSTRVLIVDDSPFFREVLRELLSSHRDIEVIAEAGNGRRAVELVREHRPDVVTMDMLMPLLAGDDAIRQIMAERPTPIIVLAATGGDPAVAMRAMSAGALDVIAKPTGGFGRAEIEELAALLRAAAHSRPTPVPVPVEVEVPQPARTPTHRVRCAGIVSSTGGPQLLRLILAGLPPNLAAPVVIVQHTIRGFTRSLASWLDGFTPLRVAVARHGARLGPGDVAIAPDDAHLAVDAEGIARVLATRRVDSHRPSGTVLLASLADSFGPAALGVVVTGMGRDGADGLAAIARAGGTAIVQAPASAVIAGMPRAALAAARSARIASPDQIARLIAERAGRNAT